MGRHPLGFFSVIDLETNIVTETIILITPRIVDAQVAAMNEQQADYVEGVKTELSREGERIEADVVDVFGPSEATDQADGEQD